MGVTGLPADFIIPQTPTELARKIEFETLAECKESAENAESVESVESANIRPDNGLEISDTHKET